MEQIAIKKKLINTKYIYIYIFTHIYIYVNIVFLNYIMNYKIFNNMNYKIFKIKNIEFLIVLVFFKYK